MNDTENEEERMAADFNELKSMLLKAESGDSFAQLDMGFFYEFGNKVAKDEAVAAEWYHKAAEQGCGLAQYCLACLYEDGRGVERDETKALEWFRKAAESGNEDAQFFVAQWCMHVLHDERKALYWYSEAAWNLHEDAVSLLEEKLLAAVDAEDEELVKILLALRGTRVYPDVRFNERNPMRRAAEKGNISILKLLLGREDLRRRVEGFDDDFVTLEETLYQDLYYIAKYKGQAECAAMLLEELGRMNPVLGDWMR